MKKSQDEFATKKDVEDLRKEMSQRFYSIEERLDQRFNDVDSEMSKNHNRVMTSLDKIVGEIQTMREERIIANEQLEDHEKRITKLETHN
ncbi:MAG: hypothetical protein ACM3IJ_02695 [Candidatus Levyibacteriota bacterium]